MLTSVRSSVPNEDFIPWILGQPCPSDMTKKWVLIVPESYLMRLKIDVPNSVLKHTEALLYALETYVPSIEGRDVLLLNAAPSKVSGQSTVEMLLYPLQKIQQTITNIASKRAIAGAMAASDWWDISLPAETAMWVDDGTNAWIRLPSGLVRSVNLCFSSSDQNKESLWITQVDEPIKGVVIYAHSPETVENYMHHYEWPEKVRWRILPLTALYEAPRDHSHKWDLVTKKKWSVITSSKSLSKRLQSYYIKVMIILFGIGIISVLFPYFQMMYVKSLQAAFLKESWKSQYHDTQIPERLEAAWNELITKKAWPETEKIPHMDPLGIWGEINRLAVWVALPELTSVRYEGNRWWLKWAKTQPPAQLTQFKKLLSSSGWHVESIEDAQGTQLVISSMWID